VEKIAIIGTGLIGGSLGMALKKAKINGVEIVAHDKEPSASSKAVRKGAADRSSWNLLATVDKASLVIIATPIMAIREVMEAIGPHLQPHCVVTDTGSSKVQVLAWADQYLPAAVSFVGGHPMAGKEQSGIDAAEATLFQGAAYCVIPGKRASPEAVKSVVGLAELVGARPFFLDAQEHDSFVAAVSHLPLVLSSALVSATAGCPSWREMGRLAATGYRDVTRLASGDPEMNRDICLTNKENIVHWINALIRELQEYRRLLTEANDQLGPAFARVHQARQRWLGGKLEPTPEVRAFEEIPSVGERMAGLFIGDRLARRSKELMEDADRKDQQKPGEPPKK